MPLGDCQITAFLATTQPQQSLAFYTQTLGLKLLEDSPFALVLAAPNALIRIQKVQELNPHPFTSLGWDVSDIRATASQLAARGVILQRFPGLVQDDLGVWKSPSGAQVCWFKDPDGNLLSLTQLP